MENEKDKKSSEKTSKKLTNDSKTGASASDANKMDLVKKELNPASEQPNTSKTNISPEELQKLLMSQLRNQGKLGHGMPGMNMKKMPAPMRFLNWVAFKCQSIIKFLDRFINFITRAEDKDRNEVIQWARSPILFGTWVMIVVIGFGGVWSATAPLDSAAVALGTVISSTKKKTIQSAEQGVIDSILVKQGDRVEKGQILMQLDETKARSNYEQALEEYRTHLANTNRLLSERDNEKEVTYDEFLLKDLHLHRVSKIIEAQNKLMLSRRESVQGRLSSIDKQISESQLNIKGLESKKLSLNKQIYVINDRLQAAQKLFKQGVIQKSVLQDNESKKAQADSDLANVDVEISKQEQQILRLEVEKININNNYLNEVVKELKDSQLYANSAFEKYINAKQVLSHMVVTSPVDGVVNNVLMTTKGGVVYPKDELFEITPYDDDLVIEAKVSPKNIDSIHPGLVAKIRFSAFKSRTTPVFTGKVVFVSPDVVRDDSPYARSGQAEPYSYVARIELDMNEFNKVAKVYNLELHPGMNAEVQIVTGTRTLLRYLIDPIRDNMFKAFIEK